jgi:prevent-host-death family protein
MQNIRISKNFVPVSEFKAQAADWLKALAADDAPVVITQNGRPAAVVLSPRAYDELTEQARFVSAVKEGIADVEAGRVVDSATLTSQLRSRYGG